MLAKKIKTAFNLYNQKGFRDVLATALSKILEPGSSFTDISNEYLNKLYWVNAGWLHRGNLYSFDYAIKNLPSDAPILEIGSFCGLSVNALNYYKAIYKAKNPLITCDKWQFKWPDDREYVGDSHIARDKFRAFVKETFIRNIRMFSEHDLPFTVHISSDDLFSAWRECKTTNDIFGRSKQLGGPISFCYIDGDHDYGCVRRDFEYCDEFLEPGGFILFDDSADGSKWEIGKVIAEVQKTKRYELVIKNPNYFFRKK